MLSKVVLFSEFIHSLILNLRLAIMSKSLCSRRDALGYIGLACLSPTILTACGSGSSDSPPTTDSRLQTSLMQAWEARYPGKAGGLTLAMISPNGQYFASTIPGVTINSHFRGASITKTFTAAGIMLLAQRGQLRIDDYITATIPAGGTSYLPTDPAFAIPYKGQIKIWHLLEHVAGVFDLANQGASQFDDKSYVEWKVDQDRTHTFTKDELIGVIASTGLFDAVPGMVYHYSDTHYTILGKIIEVVSGMSLNDFMTQEFLVPNQLDQTSFIIDGNQQTLPSPYITGYSFYSTGEVLVTDYNYSYDPGSGNLVTTPSNLVRWIRRLIKAQTSVSSVQITRMRTITPPATSYGLGLAHRSGVGYDLGWGHSGGTGGYVTDAYHDPITDVSYVLQSSLFDLTDFSGEADWLAQTAIDARKIIGY